MQAPCAMTMSRTWISGLMEPAEPQPETPDQPEPDSALIARLTEEILKKLR